MCSPLFICFQPHSRRNITISFSLPVAVFATSTLIYVALLLLSDSPSTYYCRYAVFSPIVAPDFPPSPLRTTRHFTVSQAQEVYPIAIHHVTRTPQFAVQLCCLHTPRHGQLQYNPPSRCRSGDGERVWKVYYALEGFTHNDNSAASDSY
jgi:hypothetical protein